MERKIGEIFEYNGEWYQCVIGYSCNDCAFNNDNCEERERITLKNKLTKEEITGLCTSKLRSDGKSVIFKKLEKDGDPFFVNIQGNNVLKQRYKFYEPKVILEDYWYRIDGNFISIEVKQKEDMKEKKQKLDKLVDDYMACRIQYAEFDKEIKALYDKEESKPTLKEFDLEAAKAGKPVCTRDGHKARIICFDRIDAKPILALVLSTDGKGEDVLSYFVSGKRIASPLESDLDLMMLSEKKEGWVNIVRGNDGKSYMGRGIFQSKEEAENTIKAFSDNLIDTVKINWEE